MSNSPRPVSSSPAINHHSSGSALLLVIGATAVLGTLAALLLSLSLLAYDGAALRVDGAQARLLSRAGLLQIEIELQAGRVIVPSSGIVWKGTLPPAPSGLQPLPTAPNPRLVGTPGSGCGYHVSLTWVLGPGGRPQSVILNGVSGAAILVDARASGWCGRGVSQSEARFAVVPGKIAVRLH